MPLSSKTKGIAPYSKDPSETRPFRICPPPVMGQATCFAVGAVNPRKRKAQGLPLPNYQGSGEVGGFSPADLRSAYKLPTEGGKGVTVAITDAYDDPKAESDLAEYRKRYSLPACTESNGCFKKVNQKGEAANYPEAEASWASETSLDLDMVSAVCQECHILLVEANNNFYSNLGPAVEKAAEMGASVISNSWGGPEFSGETGEDHYYNHPGIPILFGAGDSGYRSEYPAASPYVIAVGGTSLKKEEGSERGWSESAWSGTGSGCSAYESKPAWQKDKACAKRTINDISAVADPNTPVSYYDSYGAYGGWGDAAGTSVATPILAGVEGLSTSSFRAAGPSAFSRSGQSGQLFDPAEGSNGVCDTYLCESDSGYDGPTGWGTPNGSQKLPTATTEAPTVESTSKVILRGSVDPMGLETKYHFEYGESTAYGNKVPASDVNAGKGTEYVEVSQSLEGLKGKTSYHYRLVATNSGGTFYGGDRVFGTTPPNVVAVEAKEVHANDALLYASLNPEGVTTKYFFDYGSSTSYGHKLPAIAQAIGSGTKNVEVTSTIGGLTGNHTYHFRVVARSAAGTTYGKDTTFTTAPSQWLASPMKKPSTGSPLPGPHPYWNSLIGISCAQQSYCMAVGNYISFFNEMNSQLWMGEEWSSEPMATPEKSKAASVSNVSCTSVKWCVAVGDYSESSEGTNDLPWIQYWNGTGWTVFNSVPPPSGAIETSLNDVKCTSSTACVAIGYYTVSGKPYSLPLAYVWNGERWAISTMPTLASWNNIVMKAVDCTSATWCMAVGTQVEGGETYAVEIWNGTEWSVLQSALPGSERFKPLRGVSCPSQNQCFAVIDSGEPSAPHVERWNGKEWAQEALPEVPGVEKPRTLGISCPTTSACTTVGWSTPPGGGQVPVAFSWNGSKWSLQSTAEPTQEEEGSSRSEDALIDVSCATAETCRAAGRYISQGGEWDGVTESVQPPSPIVSTGAMTTLGGDEVTLNGTITTNGASSASYWFEYGKTTLYEKKTEEGTIGSSLKPVGESAIISGLEPNTTYHYRMVASNGGGEIVGEDREFKTDQLSGMAITEPFNKTSDAVSNFASNWSALGWASGTRPKGENKNIGGWGPYDSYPTINGAYYEPTVSDVGGGIADVVTMEPPLLPGINGHYFSLWLDMSSPASTRSGYQLTFIRKKFNVYEVKLSKWESGSQTLLASTTGYSFVGGDSFALVDRGAAVSAWTNTGSGFSQMLSASDSSFEGGNAGVEGAGNDLQLTNFKVGELLTPVGSAGAALEALASNDPFATEESPLSYGGAFAALAWDNGTAGHNTGRVSSTGWGPYDAYPAVNGADWQKASFADTGAGDGVSTKFSGGPESVSRYFALWLNMPDPASVRSGYEASFQETSANVYEVVLAKWVAGTQTILASKTGCSFPKGSLLALQDNDGTVSIWTKTGAEYTQLLSASDSTYTSGYTGIEGSGNNTRLTEFRSGPLPPT